jgi:hemerythrin-like metal-binding domain
MITWNVTMSTGFDHLDEQHKVLFEKFNELELAFSTQDTAAITRAVGDFLDFMQFYAAWHFQQEEECMFQHNCPVAAVNKNLHAVFLQRFNEFYTRWQQGERNLDLARETYATGATWLKNHVIGIDTQLRGFPHG